MIFHKLGGNSYHIRWGWNYAEKLDAIFIMKQILLAAQKINLIKVWIPLPLDQWQRLNNLHGKETRAERSGDISEWHGAQTKHWHRYANCYRFIEAGEIPFGGREMLFVTMSLEVVNLMGFRTCVTVILFGWWCKEKESLALSVSGGFVQL